MTHEPVAYHDTTDQDPFPFYERLHSAPPCYDAGMQAWLFAGYDECAFILRRGDLFRRVDSVLPDFEDTDGRGIKGRGRKLEMLPLGEEHSTLHKYLVNLISPEVAAGFRAPIIRPVVERLINRFETRGRAELGEEFADLVPMTVTAAMLGLDSSDASVAHIRRLRRDIRRWQESQGRVPEDVEIATRAAHEFKALLLTTVRARKVAPRDDLISELWRSGPLPDWNEDDVVLQCMGYFGGATETQHFLRNLIYALLAHPELHPILRADPESMIPRFVEEVLRTLGPVHWQPRVAVADVTLGGVAVRAGERVLVLFAAANRDPHRYADPHAIDLSGTARKGHLAFGLGPRFCIGSALARAQGIEAVEGLLARLRGLRLDPAAPAPNLRAFHVRSFDPLHVLFDPQQV